LILDDIITFILYFTLFFIIFFSFSFHFFLVSSFSFLFFLVVFVFNIFICFPQITVGSWLSPQGKGKGYQQLNRARAGLAGGAALIRILCHSNYVRFFFFFFFLMLCFVLFCFVLYCFALFCFYRFINSLFRTFVHPYISFRFLIAARLRSCKNISYSC
jgi:hypothetical protein